MGGAHPVPPDILAATIQAVKDCHGDISLASKHLGIPRSTIRDRLKMRPDIKAEAESDRDRWKRERLERDLRDLREENVRLSALAHAGETIKHLIHDCDRPVAPPKWLTPKHTPNLTGVPHLFLSDWHWDEVVDPKQMNGVNAYNREIAVRRLETCFAKATSLLFDSMHKPQYDYCTVILGGDMLSGNIHEELRETNETPIAQSILHLLDHLVAGFTMLHNRFGKLYIPCVVGNHGRFDKKPRAKHRAHDNFEFLLYHFLKKHFRTEPSIHFDIADGAFLPFQTYGTKYLLAHGDQAKGGSGIAGALSPLMLMDHRTRKRAMATDQPYHVLLLGHWHQLMSVKGMRINGCFPAGSPVTLADGTTKPIEAIAIGEAVVTRQGNIRQVVDTMVRDTADELVGLRCGTRASEIKLTPNHRVWGVKGSTVAHQLAQNGKWVKTAHHPKPGWIEAALLSVGDYIEVPAEQAVADNDAFSDGFCRLLGFYLSEGSASGANGKLHHLDFTLHRKEEAYANFIYDECLRAFGKARHFLSSHRLTSRSVVVNSSAAAAQMVALGGKGALGKRLRQDLMQLPPKKQRHILLGWLLGDGHTTTNRRFKQGIVVSGSTISRTLVEQMRTIAIRCGYFASMNCLRSGTAGNRHHDSYHLLFTGDTARQVAMELGEFLPEVHTSKRERSSDFKSMQVGGSFFARITDAWVEAFTGSVYNITVEGDHSYIVNGYGVANSGKGLDEWALGQGFDYELPAQDLWITHPDHHVTAQWPIYLEKKETRF